MEQLMINVQSYRVAAAVVALAVVGCGGRGGGGSGFTSTPSLPMPAIIMQHRPAVAKTGGQPSSEQLLNAAGKLNGSASTSAASYLYVARLSVGGRCRPYHCPPPRRGDVEVYAEGGKSVLRTISRKIRYPVSMAFDGAGNLYVLDTGNRQVNVYARDSNKLLHTITQGVRTQGWSSPYFLALDRSGYLYVGNGNNYSSKGNTVTVYAPGSTTVLRTISQGISEPNAAAFDGSGNLYVANTAWVRNDQASVTVYAPGSGSVLRRIVKRGFFPTKLALDGSGNLYVAWVTPRDKDITGGEVTVYAPNSTSVLRTMPYAHQEPLALAFDTTGNLYVLLMPCVAYGLGSVVVYAKGTTTVLRTISQGLPTDLTVDGAGNLYVYIGSQIKIYAPGSTSVRRIINFDGNEKPFALAIGP